MSLASNPEMSLWIARLASAALLLACLMFIATFLLTGAFAAEVPGGSQAVGLVVPLLVSVCAAVLLLTSALLAQASGRLAGFGASAGIYAGLLSLGAGVAAVMVLLAWMARAGAWVPALGVYAGGLAPLAAGVLLWISLWWPSTRVSASIWPKLLVAAVLVSALIGVVLVVVQCLAWSRQQQAQWQRAFEAQAVEDIERARRSELSGLDRLREDYAQMSADAPLWVFIAYLPDTTDAEERAFIVQRALRVPDFEAALARTITDRHPRYRHGAVELMRYVASERIRPGWSALLARSIEISAEEMSQAPNWLTANELANPDPIGHLRALRAAAERLGGGAALETALGRLRAAVAGLSSDSAREAAAIAIR